MEVPVSWSMPAFVAGTAPDKLSNWQDMPTLLGLADRHDSAGNVFNTAANQLKRWLRYEDGPFWTHWVEYCAWDSLSARTKPRTWQYPQVRAVKDSPKVKSPSPNWTSTTTPQFIARLVVGFLYAARDASPMITLHEEDNDMGFAHAYSVVSLSRIKHL